MPSSRRGTRLNLPPNVAARFLQGAGHLPHWRDPDLIAGLVAGA